MISNLVTIRCLNRQHYQTSWQAMRALTDARDENTPDEIWLLEHEPVFTQGQNGKAEHILDPGSIPIVQTDRGGQITYHGPGQLMVYTLIDLKRKKFNIRQLVTLLEQSIIDFLASHGISANAKCDAPGVYIDGKKICSIGLRIRRGCSYHGIAFNINMDLSPFKRINPCGFAGLKMTQLTEWIPDQCQKAAFSGMTGTSNALDAGKQLVNFLIKNLGYTAPTYDNNFSSK